MRVLVIGSNGQLGTDMCRIGSECGLDIVGIDMPTIDLTDPGSIELAMRNNAPDTVINCSAYTAVDECEKKRELAFAVNRDGVASLARAAAASRTRVVHFSTDYVFDGTRGKPYVESDQPSPRSVYGLSKLAGEQALAELLPERHQVLRLAWLYGAHGNNFVKTMVRLAWKSAAEGTPLRVVADQYGSPTWSEDVCRQTFHLLQTGEAGVFHATSEGYCSWYDFASRIIQRAGIDASVSPCSTAEFPRPAPRPPFGVLENQRLKSIGINDLPAWEDAFERFFERYGQRITTQEASA